MQLASLLVGHNTLGGGDDSHAQTLENLWQLLSTGVDPQAGLGDALQAGQSGLLLRQVLQGDVNDALVAVVNQREGLDVALVQQAFFRLEAGTSTVSCLAELAFRIRVSISATGSVICMLKSSFKKLRALPVEDPEVSGECAPQVEPSSQDSPNLVYIRNSPYQLALRTPGIWPL